VQIEELLDPGSPFSWRGVFRRADLPEGPAREAELTIGGDERVFVRVFGRFSDSPVDVFATFDYWDLVGRIEYGIRATVVHTRNDGGVAHVPGPTEIHAHGGTVLLGEQYLADPLAARFDRVEVFYDELRPWTNFRGLPNQGWQDINLLDRIRFRPPSSRRQRVLERLVALLRMTTTRPIRRIGYLLRPPFVADVPELGTVSLRFLPAVRPTPGGADLSEEGGFFIELERPLLLSEMTDAIQRPLDRLLSLAFDRKVTRRRMRIRLDHPTTDDEADRWFHLLDGYEAPRPEPGQFGDPLAIYATPSNFEQLMISWFALHNEQRRAFNFFFETAYGGERVLELANLHATTALESYHRTDVPVQAAEKQSFDADRERAADFVAEQGLNRRVLAGPHGVEPPLPERIRDLFNRQQAETEVRNKKQRRAASEFGQRVAFLRNGVAHGLEQLDSFTLDELYDYRRALLALMKLELLRRLGATLEERVKIVDHMQWRAPGGLSAFGADRGQPS
jgi:hypothetical protein